MEEWPVGKIGRRATAGEAEMNPNSTFMRNWRSLCFLAAALAFGAGGAAQAASQPEFVTLGTAGGPIIHLERSQAANAVVVDDAVYLFDTGNGVQRQMRAAGLPLDRVRAVFISHHHLDHNADLGPLLMNRWLQGRYDPIPVIGPPGTKRMVTRMAAAFQPTVYAPIMIGGPPKPGLLKTLLLRDLPKTVDTPYIVFEDDKVRVLAIANDHFHFAPGSVEQRVSRSYSYRIESRGRTMVYTGDTGPSANLELLARDADLLVTEVIDMPLTVERLRRPEIRPEMIDGLAAHMERDHLTPSAIAQLAKRARVKKVVLTHLVPSVDGRRDLSGFTEGLRGVFDGEVIVANDLDKF